MSWRFDFDCGNIAGRYDRGRDLPAETIVQWLDETAKHVPVGVSRILDLGCGTGRFTAPLATRFSAKVCGLDRSEKMLSVAQKTPGISAATLVRATADALPFLDHSFDLIFISMVLHHIRSDASALAEMRRVLKSGGKLLIRTSSTETMRSYLWAAFFPAAAEIEAARVLPRKAIADLLESQGFIVETHRVLDQVFASDIQQYCGKIAQRSLSSLVAIPDPAFEAGLVALAKHCAAAGGRQQYPGAARHQCRRKHKESHAYSECAEQGSGQ